MSINLLIKEAKQAYQSGNLSIAQRKLRQAVKLEPQHPKLWLSLAKLAKSPTDATLVYQEAKANHPYNPQIQMALEKHLKNEIPSKFWGTRPFLLSTFALISLLACLFWGGIWLQRQQSAQNLPERLELVSRPDNELLIEQLSPPELPQATATPQNLVGKLLVQQDAPRATWTVTPTPSPTPTPTPSVIPTFVSSNAYTQEIRPFGVLNNERWIDINLTTQVLKAYEGDYLVFSTPISSGTAEHRTVTGQFRIWLKFESQTMDGSRLGYDYYLENVPYVMYFFEDYAIHGAYWHSNFGNPMSHGCVNVEPSDAGWLFNWANYGTMVNVHY